MNNERIKEIVWEARIETAKEITAGLECMEKGYLSKNQIRVLNKLKKDLQNNNIPFKHIKPGLKAAGLDPDNITMTKGESGVWYWSFPGKNTNG